LTFFCGIHRDIYTERMVGEGFFRNTGKDNLRRLSIPPFDFSIIESASGHGPVLRQGLPLNHDRKHAVYIHANKNSRL
jgi:hypothetical protein